MENTISRRFTNICVFCGSSSGKNSEFEETAEQLGKVLVKKKIHLVYGGGNFGLMGRVSKAACDGGSQVLGIIPKALSVGGITSNTIGKVRIVSNMHERKAEMFSHTDAFIALPGGLGTLEELFEVTSWAQLKIHQKPIGLLNVNGFYDGLLSFLDSIVEKEFISPQTRRILVTASDTKFPPVAPFPQALNNPRKLNHNPEIYEIFKQVKVNIPLVLAEKKIHLVYGGGNLGVMGRVSKAAYDGGSQVLGIIPKALSVGGITGNTIGEVQIVSDMHERKAEMFSHADAFIALPGGFGTLEELFEANICGFYDGLLSFLDHAVENQFISPLARRIIVTASNVHQLIEQLETNIGLSWAGLHDRVNWAVFTIWAIPLSRKFQIL
ncbi:hypothetical protein ACOSQ3_028647 [Xanthoceras sorbifolium]